MPSPTALVAERVKQATADRADLFLTGVMMGGGPDQWAVEAHLREGLRVFATPDAARTFDDDLSRVEAMGVRVVDAHDAGNGARRIEMRDFYAAELMGAMAAFGVSTAFDAVAVAVFDHGAAPPASAIAGFVSIICASKSSEAPGWPASGSSARRSPTG